MSYKGTVSKRDEQIVADTEADRALMCSARGCPNRWSVEGDRGRACSAHYWADPRDWPRITQALVEAEMHRARWNAAARPETLAEPVSLEMRKAAVAALQAFIDGERNPKAWARELQRRHQAGERLTKFQVECYRTALRLDIAVSNDDSDFR